MQVDTRFRKDAVSNRCHSDMRHNGTPEIIAMDQSVVKQAVSMRSIPADILIHLALPRIKLIQHSEKVCYYCRRKCLIILLTTGKLFWLPGRSFPIFGLKLS